MRLNVKEVIKKKDTIIVSSKEALAEINRVNWSEDVLNGKKRVKVKAI